MPYASNSRSLSTGYIPSSGRLAWDSARGTSSCAGNTDAMLYKPVGRLAIMKGESAGIGKDRALGWVASSWLA